MQPPVTWPNTARRWRACCQGWKREVRRLAAPEVLLGFSVDDAVLLEDEELEKGEFDTDDDDDMEEAEDEAGDDVPRLSIDVWLFMWPAPLSPARVRIMPDIAAVANDTESDRVSYFSARRIAR